MQSALSKTGTMSLGLSLTIVMERCQSYRWSRGNREHLWVSVFSLEVGGGGGGGAWGGQDVRTLWGFSLTWAAALQIYWNKRIFFFYIRERLNSLRTGFTGTPTWWTWRSVKTLFRGVYQRRVHLCSAEIYYPPLPYWICVNYLLLRRNG